MTSTILASSEDVTVTLLVMLVVFWIACALFTRKVALSKGYDGEAWTLLGLLFGLVALIAAAGLPVVQAAAPRRGQTKRCPDCAGQCPLIARICGQCRFEFPHTETLQLLCDAMLVAPPPHLDECEAALRESRDEAVLEALHRAAQKIDAYTDLPRLQRVLHMLIDAGEVPRLTWFAERLLRSQYPADSLATTLQAIARTGTVDAARLLAPMLGRVSQANKAILAVGPQALPVLDELAASGDKHVVKAAARAAARIRSAPRVAS